MLDAKIGEGWTQRTHEPAFAEAVLCADDPRACGTCTGLKASLMTYVRGTRAAAVRVWKEAAHVVGAGTLLTPSADHRLRARFATYKRADLMFATGPAARAARHTQRPVQLVFAGKAHPADGPARKAAAVYKFTRDPAHRGTRRLHRATTCLGRRLTQGGGPWLNLAPRAAGGERHERHEAALNVRPRSAPSTVGGPRRTDGRNGWAIPTASQTDPEAVDAADVAQLYALLGSRWCRALRRVRTASRARGPR